MDSLVAKGFRRRVVATISVVALLSLSVLVVFAQEGVVSPQSQGQLAAASLPASAAAQDTQNQGQSSITQQIKLSPEVGKQRVGVDPNNSKLLALQDAVNLALQNNLDIEAFRQGVQISESNLFALRGFYDVNSSAFIGYRSAITPTSRLTAGGTGGSLSSKALSYNFTTSQQIERTGGNYLIELDNTRLTSGDTFSQLNPTFTNSITVTFTQPLLRDFSIDQTRRSIKIAKKSLDLSDSQFRQRVIEIINSVQRAYWDLVFAIQNEQIARESVELTRTQLENNQKMVEAGTLAPIELRSTEAALEQRKGDVILALQQITTSENVLKGLLMKDPNDTMWSAALVPTDQPQFGQTSFNLPDATSLALKNRPELDQMRLQTEQKQIDIDFFNNQTKPQLDLVGTYGNNGLAGTPGLVTAIGEDGRPILDQNGNPVLVPANVPSRFRGGFFRSFANLFSQDFRTYQVGVTLSFPWRNRTAEGNLGRSLAEMKQLDARQRQLVQNVQIDVRNALQAVEAARQRFEAARAGRLAAEAQYQGELEKFRAGLSTNFFVLERQTDLAAAKGQEVRALTDYNKALADLQRVTGMTLINNNVQVTARPGQK